MPNAAPSAPMEWSAVLITRGGVVMKVRPVLPTDEPLLERLFSRVSPEDLRHRFLCAVREAGHDRLASMVQVDYDRTISFLAFDTDGPIATAMLASDDGITADVAVTVRSDMKGRGIGWTLLQHVMRYARSRRFRTLRSVETRDNIRTIDLEREAGFAIAPCEGDPGDVVAVKAIGDS